MHTFSNPLLAFLLRRGRTTLLSWPYMLAGGILLTAVSAAGLMVMMLVVDTYQSRDTIEAGFALTYVGFVLGSVVLPPIISLFSTLLMTRWVGQDDKFDLLRLTPLENCVFVRTYLIAALHRMRLLIALQMITALLLPLTIVVWEYWADHPAKDSATSGYISYSVYDRTTPLEHVGNYLVSLEYNLALVGLSLLGVVMGVRFGIHFRSNTRAMMNGVGATCGSLVGLAAFAICGIMVSNSWLFEESNFDSTIEFLLGISCVSGLCILPVFGLSGAVIKMAERVVRPA